jgi:1-acyl-sn-glycerol-3-phosphate acyltransferase
MGLLGRSSGKGWLDKTVGDVFYRTVRTVSYVPFITSGRATVIGADRVPPSGPLLVAPNHVSWYDIPLLAVHNRRLLDFLASYKLYETPVGRWFYENMNGIRFDSTKPDAHAVHRMRDRLGRGRCVVIFPEGQLCRHEDSVFTDHRLYPGMARLAISTQVPVLPVVLLDTDVYRRFRAWMPVRGVRYGLAFGAPIPPPAVVRPIDRTAEAKRFEEKYRHRMRALRAELIQAMQADRA